ncbi:unnamed protein product [Medioppia subpectinata]|uniref:Uncharacterized protein n=1 Tax=Medioppia subpectinata TaxID=1979941 RepID=A0A7R9L4G9_9ACAR|nr:unnamed protein product [Medioppia subpectinata]CAG2114142.1 unnamed protein product [Medioppia subpectinata]
MTLTMQNERPDRVTYSETDQTSPPSADHPMYSTAEKSRKLSFGDLESHTRETITACHTLANPVLGFNVLLVTASDLVYGLRTDGYDGYGCLAVGDRRLDSLQLIPRLCKLRVQYFVNGYDFALAVTAMNDVYSWGDNEWGQLGGTGGGGADCGQDIGQGLVAGSYFGGTVVTDATDGYLSPRKLSFFEDKYVQQISCGSYHSLALMGDGVVYAWGDNSWGQLGSGPTDSGGQRTPTRVPIDAGVHSVYCHSSSSYAIAEDGRVYSWGENSDHQLGHRTADTVVFEPRSVVGLRDVKSVAASQYMTYFLTTAGRLYYCGHYYADMGAGGGGGGGHNGDGPDAPAVWPMETERRCDELQQFRSHVEYFNRDFICALMDGRVYNVFGPDTVGETEYNTFVDFYATVCQISYNTLRLVGGGGDDIGDELMALQSGPVFPATDYRTELFVSQLAAQLPKINTQISVGPTIVAAQEAVEDIPQHKPQPDKAHDTPKRVRIVTPASSPPKPELPHSPAMGQKRRSSGDTGRPAAANGRHLVNTHIRHESAPQTTATTDTSPIRSDRDVGRQRAPANPPPVVTTEIVPPPEERVTHYSTNNHESAVRKDRDVRPTPVSAHNTPTRDVNIDFSINAVSTPYVSHNHNTNTGLSSMRTADVGGNGSPSGARVSAARVGGARITRGDTAHGPSTGRVLTPDQRLTDSSESEILF